MPSLGGEVITSHRSRLWARPDCENPGFMSSVRVPLEISLIETGAFSYHTLQTNRLRSLAIKVSSGTLLGLFNNFNFRGDGAASDLAIPRYANLV